MKKRVLKINIHWYKWVPLHFTTGNDVRSSPRVPLHLFLILAGGQEEPIKLCKKKETPLALNRRTPLIRWSTKHHVLDQDSQGCLKLCQVCQCASALQCFYSQVQSSLQFQWHGQSWTYGGTKKWAAQIAV